MGTLFVDKLDPQSGTSLELGSSGDTVSVNTGATTNLAGNVTLGASGKTITVPAGATITNNGTQTGFGGDNKPYFNVYRNGTQSLSNNSHTVVQFNAEVFDPDNKFDTSTYRFTPAVAGFYFLHAQCRVGVQANGNISAVIRKNGSAIARALNDNSDNNTVDVSILIESDDNDYFDVECFQNTGATRDLTGSYENTFFVGYKIIS
jgi:hypothetical protein